MAQNLSLFLGILVSAPVNGSLHRWRGFENDATQPLYFGNHIFATISQC